MVDVLLRCAVCGADGDGPDPWRCPNATATDRHHVLFPEPVDRLPDTGLPDAGLLDVGLPDVGLPGAGVLDSDDPFVRYAPRSTWVALAMRTGAGFDDCVARAAQLGDALERSGSPRFAVTPLVASTALAAELGCAAPVWVKDETAAVAGSHKARHLASILLYLLATESTLGRRRERLAIASCGNAALAAATLASAVDWPLTVFVPTWMDDAFGRLLDRLGADVVRCERRDGDPPGDPTLHRFRAAVASGAVPFTVQGPENALCLDGGRTLGWEIGEQLLGGLPTGGDSTARERPPRRAFVQVGGGALGTCLGMGLHRTHPDLRIDPVQAAGCAPFATRHAARGCVASRPPNWRPGGAS